MIHLSFYLVSQKDYERRQVIREYVKQNMTVDGKQINYMIVVATDDKTVISGLEKENELYHDILVSVHVDNYANVTYTILDSFMWIRDYCSHAHFIAKVDGDAWVHFGNLVHYLKSVPSTGFYGGHPLNPLFTHRIIRESRLFLMIIMREDGLMLSEEHTYSLPI